MRWLLLVLLAGCAAPAVDPAPHAVPGSDVPPFDHVLGAIAYAGNGIDLCDGPSTSSHSSRSMGFDIPANATQMVIQIDWEPDTPGEERLGLFLMRANYQGAQQEWVAVPGEPVAFDMRDWDTSQRWSLHPLPAGCEAGVAQAHVYDLVADVTIRFAAET